jgi:putative MATE family efflux protein
MHDLTTGPIVGHLMRTGGFMLFTMVFQTLYFLVDLYWVGSLGKEAVAATGLAGNTMFVVLALTQMLGVGTTTLVAHAVGAKDAARARHVFNQAQGLSLVAGIVFLAVGTAVTSIYARTLSADSLTATLAVEYLRWFVPALALQFALVALGAALRGVGDFKPGMIVQTGTVVLNIVLAPIFIFGWGTGRPMGVAGAAMATFVAVAVGVLWLSRYVAAPGSFLVFDRRAMVPNLGVWRRLLGIGAPAGVEFGLIAVYMVVVYALSRPFGAEAQAGFGIGQRVIQAGFMPVVALGFAVAPVAGQNFGARLAGRVRETFRVAVLMAVAGMAVLVALCHVAPAALIGVFSTDPTVVGVGAEYLRIVSWNFVASGVVFVGSSMFQAMGNTLPTLVTSGIRVVLVAVPAFALSRRPDFRLVWVWYLSVAAVTVQMVLSLWLLNGEFRRRLQFSDDSGPSAAPAPAPDPIT